MQQYAKKKRGERESARRRESERVLAPRISGELRRWPANDDEVRARLSMARDRRRATGGRLWWAKQRREREKEFGVFFWGFF